MIIIKASNVLNPLINYSSGFLIHTRTLSLVQIGNKFDELIYKTYIKDLEQIYKKMFRIKEVGLVLQNLPSKDGRKLCGGAMQFFGDTCQILTGLNIEATEFESVDDYIKTIKETVRNFRKDVLNYKNGIQTPASEFIKIRYEQFAPERKTSISLSQYIDTYSRVISTYLLGINDALKVLKRELNFDELDATLKEDASCLAIAKQVLEHCKIVEKLTGHGDEAIVFAYNYKQFFEDSKSINLSLAIQTYEMDGKQVYNYTQKRFFEELDEYLAKHPEFRFIDTSIDAAEDYHDYDKAVEFSKRKINEFRIKELSGSWEIIPKGNKDSKVCPQSNNETVQITNSLVSLEHLTEDEQLIRARSRNDFLESTDYLYSLKGVNNFTGYIGFMYKNGVVIFEKVYESLEPLVAAKSNATYVMSIKNFVEMSQKTKTEIIEYIKSGNIDVKRKYHSYDEGKWKSKILREINGDGYTDQTIEILDSILKSGVLSQELDEVSRSK